ncbi:class I SAM-dependent methyltransferase [Spirochaeta cellobiosiphila]|uniref:class I SAM-dependent methyltransferase n=1 Tax=Spirochaeta cellobiosiphila TaxID=504483 RepID=UPI00040AB77F|nr:class I SAM-dependent methyltransferase [Spirochaeta cellobiosiphila]
MKTYSTTPGVEEKKLINCHICGSSSFKQHWVCEGFIFKKCKDCGVLLQNPQPVPQALIDRYSDEYFDYEIENEEAFYKLMELGLNDIDFYKLTETWNKNNSKFLDVGCATGKLLESKKKEGWIVKGVEVCQPAVDYGRKVRGVDIFHGTIEQAPFKDGEFDFIHFSHVIEHIPDPIKFMNSIRRVCSKDGYVAITTPNYNSLQARLFKKDWRSAIADHVYLYSEKTLVKLLKSTGFKIIKVRTWGGLAKGVGPKFLKKILDPLSKRVGFGDVIMVLAIPV